jgi:hypothetical protein
MAYKYNVSESDRKVECLSSFAGKPVSGVAKCDPGDNFSVETGKKLAKARCDYKVSKKRKKKAYQNYARALKDFEAAKERLYNASEYIIDATLETDKNFNALKEIESSLK